MAHADLIRTDEGMPVLPDISKMSDTQKINALFAYIRQEQDYIVRLKEQIGFELQQKRGLAIHTHARIATQGRSVSNPSLRWQSTLTRELQRRRCRCQNPPRPGNPHSRANCNRETVLQFRLFDCVEAPVLRSFFIPIGKSVQKYY